MCDIADPARGACETISPSAPIRLIIIATHYHNLLYGLCGRYYYHIIIFVQQQKKGLRNSAIGRAIYRDAWVF